MNAPFPSDNVEASAGGAGASNTETLLLDIWKRVLRVREIGRDDNFFDLGGDSLLAVILFLQIEQETGAHLPVTAIFDAPSVSEMARLIEENSVPQSSSLVLLKPGSGGDPLFIVHGIGGTVMELTALARNIRIPGAVYAIRAHGLDGQDEPLATIEDMADDYVQAIRAIQPSGPYRLCGYSFGGLIAMEMARRLKAQSESIGALILMDSYAHPSTWPRLSRVKMRVRRGFSRLLDRPDGSRAETFSHLLAHLNTRDESDYLHEWLLDQNPSLPLPLLRVREAGGAALRAYRPKPYDGPITFLKASRRDAEFPDDPERIWRRLAPDIRFRTIPGAHRTIVTQDVETAAAALTACLYTPSFFPHGRESRKRRARNKYS